MTGEDGTPFSLDWNSKLRSINTRGGVQPWEVPSEQEEPGILGAGRG